MFYCVLPYQLLDHNSFNFFSHFVFILNNSQSRILSHTVIVLIPEKKIVCCHTLETEYNGK